MKKPRIAIVRGKFLNQFDMQSFAPLMRRYDLTAIGSMAPMHRTFPFPVVRLPSPMDLPDFPYRLPLLNRVFTDAQYLVGLEKCLRGYDLVHTAETYYHYTRQSLEAKRLGMVKKVIATVWETIPHNNEGIRGRSQFKDRAIRDLDHIIAVTTRAKQALISEGADARKISVIGAHVDTKIFFPHKGWLDAIHASPKKPLTILFCGRFVPEKGVEEILSAMHRLAHTGKLSEYRLHWRFVGGGPLKKRLEAGSRLNLKNWHSTIESAKYPGMPEIYRQADLVIAPSKPTRYWEEQYGMTLLEAQASGLPIVTTRSGGIPENVGDSALLVPPGDASALASAIQSLVTRAGLRRKLAAAARTRAVHVHDIKIGARQLAAVYERVLST